MFIQRSSLRLADGWHRLKGWRGAYVRDLVGHHLVVFHGATPQDADSHWHTWIDGRYRGHAKRLKDAQRQLEEEARGTGPMWDKMKAFLAPSSNPVAVADGSKVREGDKDELSVAR